MGFLFEHKIRIYLCIFFGVIDLFLIFLDGIGHNIASLLLMIVLIGFCALNMLIVKFWEDAELLKETDKGSPLSDVGVEMTDKMEEDDENGVTRVNAAKIQKQ